ncbi:hypothetical protein PoB_003440900 [Plakobranchus ocellatus]|uniref:Secreted protein n=1 Tax=Plakobranchus ocellatus TaxID=259542 RepID=A0AAV4ANX2_9GAST|nr:hypothetical protein PoB_003440900 [Plakobranchus ocellatus]
MSTTCKLTCQALLGVLVIPGPNGLRLPLVSQHSIVRHLTLTCKKEIPEEPLGFSKRTRSAMAWACREDLVSL